MVGHLADQVKATVSAKHPDVSYVLQPEPNGTGHAASVAVEALAAQGHRGDVVIVMGDKVPTTNVVTRFLQRLHADDADLVLTTLPHNSGSTSGRVVPDGQGAVAGIIEVSDLRKAKAEGRRISFGNRALTAEEIEDQSLGLNPSMYGFRMAPLQDALQHLDGGNAQGELYLTDTVEYLAARGPVDVFHVEDPTELMTFDTREDLLTIEEALLARKATVHEREAATGPRNLMPIAEWLTLLGNGGPELRETLAEIYGADPAVIEERRRSMLDLLDSTADVLGPERAVVISRAPGRVNLMGRHVDHRGGYVNVMAISRELLVAASPR